MRPLKASLFLLYCVTALAVLVVSFSNLWRRYGELRTIGASLMDIHHFAGTELTTFSSSSSLP